MGEERISVLLCEDMEVFSQRFLDEQSAYFEISVCADIHLLPQRLHAMHKAGRLPDVLLLDLFSRRYDVPNDREFARLRAEVDRDVEEICQLLTHTGEKARKLLNAHGISYLRLIRKEFPEYQLPILLYSRLGPYILHPEEAAAVDEYNSEFLLKWLDPDEQRKKIYRFYNKWRSSTHPIALEISRKLSTLPQPLVDAVAEHLEKGKFKSVVMEGCLGVTKRLQEVCKSSEDGGRLASDARAFLLKHGRRRDGEDDGQFNSRVRAVCDLYKGVYVILRNKIFHDTYTQEEWRYADACLSVYSLIWIGLDDLTA